MSNTLSAQRHYVVISKNYMSATPLYEYTIWSRETGAAVYRGFETYNDQRKCAHDAQEALDMIEAGEFDNEPMHFSVGQLFYTNNYGV